ncbi:MAG: FtsK/SpoIIIE domain-containing protein, partial [Phycisphaerales bacterium]|nr:FtsK/SpoIIIE domain-containing protein [Phycisphaerales bacterium]
VHLKLPDTFSVPAMLELPDRATLLVEADHAGRAASINLAQMVMARLLTQMPAGRVKFTLFDPVGLGQSFAGFMHLADHDESLVGSRIWTESEHMEQRLSDLTEHMETVIQKYLRNEYATIDQYNAQAGELAEPIRFLVVADFPTGFEQESLRRLASIATTGPRCGVYTIILRDTRTPLPPNSRMEEVIARSVHLLHKNGTFTWNDAVLKRFPLHIDPPAGEKILTALMDKVGKAAKEAKRVEVPFQSIAPPNDQFWSLSSKSDLRVPVGKCGATRLQSLRLGIGVAQHALVAGKTGSGKSNFMHTIVTNMSMWYGPDEVEFYLVDFKKGVEFKAYATSQLPHARAIAVESDREFGLSVLQRVDAELTRRGTMFRDAGAQEISMFRDRTGQKLPRTILLIDEFQEFFSEDDKLAQEASALLDRLVRQGRAFGIHIILGSQTIGGSSGLARSTLGQIAVRVALQCTEADSQMILGDNNSAARLLTRPGEAVYNDAGGLVEANSPFQIAFLPDAQREGYLEQIQKLSHSQNIAPPTPIVFEGNSAAIIRKNDRIMTLLQQSTYPPAASSVPAYIGEPVAIKDPTAVPFRRQSGANVLMVGQQEESAIAIFASMIASLAAQQKPGDAIFYLLDGSPADSRYFGLLEKVIATLPHETKVIPWRDTADAINALAAQLKTRQANEEHAAPAIYLLIFGLQRYRILRHQEDDFSFSKSDEESKPKPDKQFAELLSEGPTLGIHNIIWADTPITLERTFDRGTMRQFDHRILFQMSASDSSNLIDSPLANRLGAHRALLYSEEQGTFEKCRPYEVPDETWLQFLTARLKNRT